MSNHKIVITFYPHNIQKSPQVLCESNTSVRDEFEYLTQIFEKTNTPYEVCSGKIIYTDCGIYSIKKVY